MAILAYPVGPPPCSEEQDNGARLGRMTILRLPTPTGKAGTHIQQYRGPSATLPMLLLAQFGFTTDTNQVFIGDGTANHFIGGMASAPASSTAAGKRGMIACDGTWLYVCYADNQWVRVAVASW
jgi:hypothetical protein